MTKSELKELLEQYLTVEVEHTTDVCLSGTQINTFVTIKFDGMPITESTDSVTIHNIQYCEDEE